MNKVILWFQRKQFTILVANEGFYFSSKNKKFWKTYIHPHDHGSFWIVKYFFDEINGNMKKCDFFDIIKEICQYLAYLHNSVNRDFLDGQYMMLQNHVRVIKDLTSWQCRIKRLIFKNFLFSDNFGLTEDLYKWYKEFPYPLLSFTL